MASSLYKVLGRENIYIVTYLWVDSKKNSVELKRLRELEYYIKGDKTAVLFFSRFSAETSWSKVKPLEIASHRVKQQGSAALQGDGAGRKDHYSHQVWLCYAVLRPCWKDYFSTVFLHRVFMRPGCLETLDLHLAREIWMTNLKLVNYAQECLLRLPNSGFCYSVLLHPTPPTTFFFNRLLIYRQFV